VPAATLTHVRLLVSDMGAAYRFYRDVLGFETAWEENPGYAEFTVAPAVSLAILPREEMEEAVELRDGGDGALLVLAVPDVDDAVRTLRGRGADVKDAVDRPDWGLRVAHLRDPDGNLIELAHGIEWVREEGEA
jgi:catechol 2,3-dioxygenase-like lactoylglutathione lyase family enzyme